MEDMSHVSGRAELTAAINSLVDAVRHLTRGALRAKVTGTAGDVERTLAGELAAAWASETRETQSKVAEAVEASPEVRAGTPIAPMTGDLPHDSGNAGNGESGVAPYLTSSSRTIGTERRDSECNRTIKENVIAAGIAELQDRLGGFIKS